MGRLSGGEPAGRPGDWQSDRLKVFRRFLARTPKSLARNNKTWTLVFRYVALLGI
jgi:hypothetical protein